MASESRFLTFPPPVTPTPPSVPARWFSELQRFVFSGEPHVPMKELFSEVEDHFLDPESFGRFQRAMVPVHRKHEGFGGPCR